MKRIFKILGIVLLLVFVFIQFIPSNSPTITLSNPEGVIEDTSIPIEVVDLLKNSCYDCHSNETKFPWYTSLAPAKWIVYQDINEGKEYLNFSEWNLYKKEDKAELLDEIYIVLEEEEMPLKKYTFMHPNARISESEKELLMQWAENELDNLYE